MTFNSPNEEKIHNLQKALDMLNHCGHRRLEIRYRGAVNKTKMYTRQCLDCGKIIPPESGMWIKKSDVPKIETIKPIDDNLPIIISATDQSLRNSLQLSLEAAKHDHMSGQYHAYLMSPEWKEKRDRVMKRANGLCEGCLKKQAENVHHKTYANIYNEFLFELVALCRDCHDKIHDMHDLKEVAP